jgi:hypothetical protein
MRTSLESDAGRRLDAKRAGFEGMLSQGVRGFGLRRRWYLGLTKTHWQQMAMAAALHLDRWAAWFLQRPHAHTRGARFAALAG